MPVPVCLPVSLNKHIEHIILSLQSAARLYVKIRASFVRVLKTCIIISYKLEKILPNHYIIRCYPYMRAKYCTPTYFFSHYKKKKTK